MATAAPATIRTEDLLADEGDGLVLLHGVPWPLYERMVEEIAHRHVPAHL